MLDTLWHKWLRAPYRLAVHHERRVKIPRATIVFLHGIGASGKMWQQVVQRLPIDCAVVTIDLLGFGASPQPAWVTYDARRQAASVFAACRRHRLKGQVIIVGHSMGALVAVELARQHPRFVTSLILCSPPLYTATGSNRAVASNQKLLTSLYRSIQAHPEQFVKISRLAVKYKLVNRAFHVDEDSVVTYMNALEACIMNQTTYDDIQRLSLPITLLCGTLDAVVIMKHLRALARSRDTISLHTVVAGHEIKGPYVTAVVRQIKTHLLAATSSE